MKESPLFWPVTLKGKTIYCLDETALPDKIVYLKARNVSQALKYIKDMKTRAVGQVSMAFYIFLLILEKNKKLNPRKLITKLNTVSQQLIESRPTFPFVIFSRTVLGWTQDALLRREDIYQYTSVRIKGYLAGLKKARVEQAKKLSQDLKDGMTVLTHCNVSGSLVLAAQFCKQQKKKVSFVATETRPYLQGSRLTAWELQRAGFDVTLIPDSAVATVMSQKKVDIVVVGADHMAQNGDFANKVGTYQIALLAKHYKIPLYVLAPPPSNKKTGRDIRIELRPDKEMLEFRGRRIAPKGAKGYYPAFDVTPAKLVTKHIVLQA